MKPLAAMVVLLASPLLGQNVKVDYDPFADFSRYRTFSWNDCEVVRGDLLTREFMPAQKYQEVLSQMLEERGVRYDEQGDVRLSCQVESRVVQTGKSRLMVDSDSSAEGQLTLELADAQTGKIVWSVTCRDSLRNFGPEDKKVRRMVASALKKLPRRFGRRR